MNLNYCSIIFLKALLKGYITNYFKGYQAVDETRKAEKVKIRKNMELAEEKKRLKAELREKYRELNEPPKLEPLEEFGNALSHAIGAGLAIAGFVLLLLKSDTGLKIMAACFYGISLVVMFLMSSLYHAYKDGTVAKRLWRRFDYVSIYLLIGGTFAPLYLVYWGNHLGISLFCAQWGLILVGIVLICVFGPGRFRPVHYTLFFVIGWSAAVFFPDWIKHDRNLMYMILGGGLIYTLGMIPFVRDRKGDHFVWHLFALGGAIVHWFGIYSILYF